MEISPRARSVAILSLIASRFAYAFNWYDVGPVQVQIAQGYHTGLAEVSWALVLFLMGVGLFQIPAGLLAHRWGPRAVSLWGLGLMGLSVVGGALSPWFPLFLAMRFLVGVGAALFFSPAIALIARYYPNTGRGFAVGIFNGAFNMGAGVAVFAAAVLVGYIGWEWTLIAGGILILALVVENLFTLPTLPEPSHASSEMARDAREVLSSGALWALALGLVGFWTVSFAVPQYLVPFLESARGFAAPSAGALDLVMVMTAFVGGPIGGVLVERTRHPRWLLVVPTLVVAALTAAISLSPTLLLWPLAVGFGVLNGVVFAVLYVAVTRMPHFRRGSLALAIGLVNGVQVFLGSLLLLVGAYFFFGAGAYVAGWYYLGAVAAVTLALLAWGSALPERQGTAAGRRGITGDPGDGPDSPA